MGKEMKSALAFFYDRNKKRIIVTVLIVSMFIIGEFFVSNFLSLTQLLITLKLASYIAIFALCQMIVIAAGDGGLDLSVGYAATVTAVFTASIMDGQNANLWKAILIAIAIGFIIGLSNGLLTSYLKLPALVITLGMASILQGVIDAYTAGRNITGKPSPVLEILAAKSSGGFPNIVFVLIILALISIFFLNKTKLGYRLFSTGANKTAAHLSGINVKIVKLAAFITSSIIASLMGLLLLGNMGTAFKDMGSNYVFPSIIAVAVGGVSLNGGEGDYFGVILGAIFLQTLSNLLVALGWGDAGKWLGYGLVLYILLITYIGNRRKR